MEISYRLRLLGNIQVEKEGTPIRDFESRKSLALLGYLARHAEPVTRSQLAGLFWGDKDEQRGRRNLSRELSLLSARLPGCFQTDYYTVQFQPPPSVWVDTIAFEQLVKSSGGIGERRSRGDFFSPAPAEGVQSVLPSSAAQLAEAVTLYRGQFMAGYFLDDCPEFETWLLSEQEAWQRQVTQVLDKLINYHASQQQDEPAQAFVRRWLTLEPWQEQAHRYLMLLLARNGQRAAALTQYETCRRVLAEELAAEPSAETVALYEQIRTGELSRGTGELQSMGEIFISAPPLARSPAPPPLKIPTPATPLVDRDEERSQIATRLADPACRLLTLIGPGGIGKTRLMIQASLEAAQRLNHQDYEHGIYFIPLDPLSSAEFLASTVADALNFSFYSGTDPLSQLFDYLREKRVLLALDNFEHLLGGVNLVADILQNAPQVKILAASRERLNLHGEWILPVQGLGIPSPASESDSPADSPAMQLFLQQAQSVQPGFSPSAEDKGHIRRICQLVEGIPLAIELAAAWVRLLSCQEIVAEIERNLDFLTTPLRNIPERHRSLRAVFNHSWQLLSPEERRVFRQLSVFRGGFRREAAAQVAGASLPLLLTLVDKSLLQPPEQGRFLRHMLLWQYAVEKLEELPEEKEQTQKRHCDYYVVFLQQHLASLTGGNQKDSLVEIGAEIENIRLSWRWAIAQGQIAAIEQSLDSLFHFYDMRSWFKEGAEAFELAAASLAGEQTRRGGEEHTPSGAPKGGRSGGAGEQAKTRSPGHPAHLGAKRGVGGEEAKGEEENRQSSMVNLQSPISNRKSPREASNLQSPITLAKLLARQGWFTFQLGQHETAKALLQEALALLRRVNLEHGQSSPTSLQARTAKSPLIFPLNYLGAVYRHLGEYDTARQYLEESQRICQEVGDQAGLSIALTILAQIAHLQGDYSQARQLGRESLTIKRRIGDYWGMTFSLNILGQIAYALEDYGDAKDIFQESLAICQVIDDRRGTGLCLNYLGDVLGKMREIRGAQQLYGESLATFREIGNQLGIISTNIKLGYNADELGDYTAARIYFYQALQMGVEIQALPAVLDALVGVATFIIHTTTSNLQQAIEILALAFNHPASSRDNQDRAARLVAELESRLPPEAVKATQTAALSPNLAQLVQTILAAPSA